LCAPNNAERAGCHRPVAQHCYRSTVQWSESLKLWIAAGPTGSDIGRDDHRTWQPLDNGAWDALSLPFFVGPKGRIAKLRSDALMP
jgi:hypothetical protein